MGQHQQLSKRPEADVDDVVLMGDTEAAQAYAKSVPKKNSRVTTLFKRKYQ